MLQQEEVASQRPPYDYIRCQRCRSQHGTGVEFCAISDHDSARVSQSTPRVKLHIIGLVSKTRYITFRTSRRLRAKGPCSREYPA